jgi:hypothetical protein
VPSTEANINQAVQFALAMKGGGGTEMLKGVQAAIDEPIDKERVRIVVMLTDGFIGNEAEIIEHVGKNCGDQVRFWCVGIGQAPNMFLVDGVAKQGGGMGKKLGLRDESDSLAQEVMTRIQRAQLAKVKVDWGGLDVVETYPAKIPELWAGRPVILFGRYRGPGDAAVNVSGVVEGESVSWPLQVKLPEREAANDVLAKVWARKKIEDLMQQSFYMGSPEVEEVVTALALDYKLMSQYTSFVAVDSEKPVEPTEPAQPPRRMPVPVPLPEGTRWEGFFGPLGDLDGDAPADGEIALGLRLQMDTKSLTDSRLNQWDAYRAGRISGVGGGLGGGFGGGGFGSAMDGRARRYLGRNGTMLADRLSLDSAPRASLSRRYAATLPAPASGPVSVAGGAMPALAARSKSYARGATTFSYSESAARPNLSLVRKLSESVKRESFKSDGLAQTESIQVGQALGYTSQALHTDAGEVLKAATATLANAKKVLESGKADAARELFVRALFLDHAAANFGASGGAVAAEALAALNGIRSDQVKEWSKPIPGLTKKLDLVLRDQPLEEAIKRVAKAAGLNVAILPGSLADAATLTGAKDLRVTYLDLRRANAAEALDWLVQPERLIWWANKGTITVGSERRRAARTAWVYDVSLISLPDGAELAKLGDPQKVVATAQKDAAEFIQVVRDELRATANDSSVVWFAPGQLLVIGTREDHAKAETLLASLVDGKGKFRGAAAALAKVTAKRHAERKEQADKLAKAYALLRVADVHEQFGWQLLSAAAAGSLDVEALTELQIAWRQPETAQLLKGEGRALVLRSWWILSEALPAIGEHEHKSELSALVKLARQAGKPAADEALLAMEKIEHGTDAEAFPALLYATLAMRDATFTAKALPRLATSSGKDDTLASARTIAKSLLADREEIDSAALSKVVSDGVAGEDLTLLLAMACRRTGGDAWTAFRGAARELLGEQPLDGNLVVLVNRLAAGQLPLVAQR